MIRVYEAARATNGNRLRMLIKKQKNRCFYCRCMMTTPRSKKPNAASVDHRLPVILGGSNGYKNIVAACKICNQNKGALTDLEFKSVMNDTLALDQFRRSRAGEIRRAKMAQFPDKYCQLTIERKPRQSPTRKTGVVRP